jgi:hypothetical protein
VVDINGLTYVFVYDPFKDDPVRNKVKHPSGHGFLSSYKYDIMGFGSIDSNSNMKIVREEGVDPVWRVVGGIRNPWDTSSTSFNSPGDAATPVDASTIHYYEEVGAIVFDPTKVIQYHPEQTVLG